MAWCFSSQFSNPPYIHAVFILFVFRLIPQFLRRIFTCAGHHHTAAKAAPWSSPRVPSIGEETPSGDRWEDLALPFPPFNASNEKDGVRV